MKGLALALLTLLALAPAALAAAGNPFTTGRPPVAKEEAAAPPPSSGLTASVAKVQQQLHEALGTQIGLVRDGKALAALTLIGIGFLYGVFHAAGPGHGKAVVASYFVARDAPLRRGFAAGALVAAGHTLSAVLLVLILGLALGFSGLGIMERTAVVEVVSYGMITAIGLVLLYRAATGRFSCCDHAHEPGHTHDGHHHGPRQSEMSGLALFASAGLAPCSGAVILMLFALANGVLLVGIAATLAIALGMMLTISLIAVIAIKARQGVSSRLRSGWAQTALSLAGALLVTGIGGLLLIGAFQRMA